MNITDAKGRWRLTHGYVQNRKTNEVRAIANPPRVSDIDRLHEETFAKFCRRAFQTGHWPTTLS